MKANKDKGTKRYYEVGIEFEASAAWKLFRCRADDNKSQKVEKLSRAIHLLSSGEFSIREVSNITGYAKNTIWQLLHKVRAMRQRDGLGEILCPCGVPLVEHRGWCWFRYGKSGKRQKTLTDMLIKYYWVTKKY